MSVCEHGEKVQLGVADSFVCSTLGDAYILRKCMHTIYISMLVQESDNMRSGTQCQEVCFAQSKSAGGSAQPTPCCLLFCLVATRRQLQASRRGNCTILTYTIL